MRYKQADIEHAIGELRKLAPPGTVVYVSCDHVARSGMSRNLKLYVVEGREIRWITGYVATALGYSRVGNGDALKIGGCGMDMGFAIVNDLSYTLHGRKSKGAEGRPFQLTRRAFRAGYSLTHRWL